MLVDSEQSLGISLLHSSFASLSFSHAMLIRCLLTYSLLIPCQAYECRSDAFRAGLCISLASLCRAFAGVRFAFSGVRI
jgi:hypothetical protein